MPTIPFPDKRIPVEQKEITVNGRDCEVFVYEEINRAFFGLFEWVGRHVRVEVPITVGGEPRMKLIHDARRRHFLDQCVKLANIDSHVEDAIEETREWIRDWENQDVGVSYIFTNPR